jgi:hypothetical protein
MRGTEHSNQIHFFDITGEGMVIKKMPEMPRVLKTRRGFLGNLAPHQATEKSPRSRSNHPHGHERGRENPGRTRDSNGKEVPYKFGIYV